MKRLMLALLLLAAGPWSLAAQRTEPPPRPALRQAPAGRRLALQQRVVARFMDRVSMRLGLDSSQRQRLEQVLRRNEAERRALAREAREVRAQLVRAASDPTTSDRDFERLLGRMSELRSRDIDLWRSEQTELATVLSPRQRAQFLAMRLEFLEMVQQARAARRPPLGGGPAEQP